MADSELEGADVFEVDRIRRLVELMKEFDLREIDLRQANQQIRMRRGGDEVAPPLPAAAGTTSSPPAAGSSAGEPAPSAARDVDAEAEHIVYIQSPMVGTFYSRPNPNSESYVNVGDRVETDTTVCVIEAMKVFNEIPAEVQGRIVAMLAEDEEPVEYGKPLFKVDTRA